MGKIPDNQSQSNMISVLTNKLLNIIWLSLIDSSKLWLSEFKPFTEENFLNARYRGNISST